MLSSCSLILPREFDPNASSWWCLYSLIISIIVILILIIIIHLNLIFILFCLKIILKHFLPELCLVIAVTFLLHARHACTRRATLSVISLEFPPARGMYTSPLTFWHWLWQATRRYFYVSTLSIAMLLSLEHWKLLASPCNRAVCRVPVHTSAAHHSDFNSIFWHV